jgi:hypothetical protein
MTIQHPASLRCTAFRGFECLASGPLREVALAVRRAQDEDGQAALLTFEDGTGKVIDLDLRGSEAEIVARFADAPASEDGGAPRGRGRPKLGVTAREVTLLPRHWDWLGSQPGGASAALRRLVDAARKTDGGKQQARDAQERSYRFLSAMGGDLPGFEEAARALFAGDEAAFETTIAYWPKDVADYALRLWAPGQDETAA